MTKTCTLLVFLAATGAADASTKTVVLGKLAQTVESTAIRRSPSSKSHVYYRTQPFEYLIVRAGKSKTWLQVIMQKGVIGYIPAEDVARLPYEVTMDQVQDQPDRNGSGRVAYRLTSRGAAAQEATKYKGTPYKWGGNDLRNGIDCSGLVQKMYGMIGVNLPRTAAEQALVGIPITRFEDLQPGDRLYFWDKKRGKIGHTGMYTGNGYFVHSSVNNRGIDQDYLTEKWRRILVSARR